MIRATKGGPLGWWWHQYVGWKFRSAFRGLRVRGELPQGEEGRLVYLNHTNWWDGFVLHQLCVAVGWSAYCLMEEENLRRYRFLARLGAFSIRRGESQSALESLRYARELLRQPRAAVGLFPEGELRPFGAGPLRLERGVELLARASGARCLPVAMRYAFFEHERPDVLVELGCPHGAAPLARFQEELEAAVARVAAVRRPEDEGFTRVLSGGLGVAERWDAMRGSAVR